MIFDVPEIKVSGIKYPVYAADFSWGGADSPSKMTIDFVNNSGKYKAPKLGTAQVVSIELGSFFKFQGYPVSYTKNNSNSAKIIQVSYIDTSVILDQIFIGLKGVHGAAPTNLRGVFQDGTVVEGTFDSKMLLLGSYVDPCDGITDDYEDPCNPCLTRTEFISLQDSNTQKRVSCEEARYTQLLDVNYTFTDLITGLKSRGVQFFSIPAIKSNFYGRYTGTARDVLRSWCSDLGMTFYWQGTGIKFIDLRKGIDINDTNFYDTCKLLSTSESQSIENNRSQGNILYFGAPGRLESYDCSKAEENSYKLSLLPITLKDIFADTNGRINDYIKKYYTRSGFEETIKGLQTAVVLAKYSRMMRDMTLLYDFYGVTDASSITEGKKMPLLGLTVNQVWDINDDTTESEGARTLFWNFIPESIRKRAAHVGAAIAVVEYNPKWHDSFYEFEKKLADDFFGRYWISFFSKGEQYTYNGPDGSPEYYDAGTPMILPFMDVIPQSMKSTAGFLTRIVTQSAALNRGSGHVGDVTTANPNAFASSFLLMDRNASWDPTENNDDVKKFESNMQSIYMFNSDVFKEEGFGDTLKVGETYMLICNKPTVYTLIESDPIAHPIENENKNRILELDSYKTTYGLRGALCRAYRLTVKIAGNANFQGVDQTMNFYTPVQAYDNYGINFPGYSIIATNNNASKANTQVFIRRAELIMGDVPRQNDETVGVIINFKDISSTIQDIISSTTNGCGYNLTEIRSLMNEFKIASSRPQEIIAISKSYTLSGFPTREILLEDGLSGFSIRYTSERGIGTEIQFSNSPPITKSENVIDQEVEKHILKRLLGKKFLSSNDKVSL